MKTEYPNKPLWVVSVQKTIEDDKGKDKKVKESYLVESPSTETIQKLITPEMDDFNMIDWEIVSITKSNIRGIFLEEN